MALLKIVGEWLFKAGKYVVKHPKKAVEVVHAGQQMC